MTMAVFDYSAIRARMERREQTLPAREYSATVHVPLGDDRCKIPDFSAAKGETVTINVQQGISVEALYRSIGRPIWCSGMF